MKILKTADRASAVKLACDVAFRVVETKDADGGMMIEGYANTVDKDRVGDVVLPGAFKRSLPAYLDNSILLYQHNWDTPIGTVTDAQVNDKGLYIKAKISGSKDCEDVRTKIREGILKTLSIGFNEVDSVYNEQTKTKTIKDLDLLEISVVTIPANPNAKFAPVAEKSLTIEELSEKLLGNEEFLTRMARVVAKTHLDTKGDKPMSVTVKKENAPGEGVTTANPGQTAPVKQEGQPESQPAENEGAENEHAMKVVELLSGILAELQKLNGAKAAEPPKKPEEEQPMEGEPCKACGQHKPKKDGEAAAPAEGGEKSLDDLSDEEVEAKLHEVTEELERLGSEEINA